MPCDYYLSPEDLKTAKENGVSAKRAHERFYYLNWSKERSVTEPIREMKIDEKVWADKAEKNGISRNTYYKRREYGWSKEKAANKPIMSRKESVEKALKHRRKKRKYPDWVYENLKKHGIEMSTFKNRVNTLLWPMDKASTTPPIKNNKEHPWRKSNDLFYLKDQRK